MGHMTTTTKTRAPYQPGDRINVLRTEAAHGTVWGPLTIDRVTALNDGQHWRIECTRLDGSCVGFLVDRTGRDRDDYTAPTR